jgi:hypothetical protein
LAKYKEAQKLDPKLEKANEWSLNGLCWDGSLRGYAAEVMTACDLAVERDPDNGQIIGIVVEMARALTGDYPGAIADFEAYIKEVGGMRLKIQRMETWKKELETYKVQRQGWVDALKKGENPFTEEVLAGVTLEE